MVGAALADDKRRCAIARAAVGDDIGIAIDANQVWDVPTAVAWINELAPFRPAWVEEPTAPEDILGTAAIRRAVRPLRVATGEHVANPVMLDRKSTRLNSSHPSISYAVFCLKKK